MNPETAYLQALSNKLKCETSQLFCYWKGRVALFAALKAIGVTKGDEVILPAFTCVVVPNAILYLGAKPIYVDIDQKTLNAGVMSIAQAVTDHTRCIIVQNTFGLSSQLGEITELAKSRGIVTIADCTHGFGGRYQEEPNGNFCDFAFFSSQWNKPFSTGIGGILKVNNTQFLPAIQGVNVDLIQPGKMKQWSLAGLLLVHRWLVTDTSYWFLQRMYRLLSRIGFVIGSSSDEELSGIEQPKGYFMSSSSVQARAGLKALRSLERLNLKRKQNAQIFTKKLKEMGKYHVDESLHGDHLFLKYPILLKDRGASLQRAEKNKIRLGEWFLSPIHPIEQEFEKWALLTDQAPIATFISAHVLNLPTDSDSPDKIVRFLEEQRENLL
jgi:dTDP-4-amino-4,6-dideoxygalactose transaminase